MELDDWCRSVLARHWPDIPQHDDVRTAPAWWASTERPPVDVVCGGFPCQPFSRAGRQRGVGDERWGWPWFADVVRLVRPRVVLVENVAALAADGDAFGWMLTDLADLGFDAEWGVLPACAVGAPHTRERLFVLAYANGGDGPTRLAPAGGPLRAAGNGRDEWRLRSERVAADGRAGRDLDGAAGRMVAAAGNAVVPAVAEYLGRRIVEHLTSKERAA